MRTAGRLASEVLDFITPHVKVGVTTEELDRLCHDYMVNKQGTVPAPLNYAPPGYPPFPKSVCTSVNNVICHGIPNQKKLKSGDSLNIDVTVIKDGFHGDTSRMFLVGNTSLLTQRLSQVCFEAMWKGIDEVKPGNKLGDIGFAIQSHVENFGYSVVREFCGHGILDTFHAEPQVLHYGRANQGAIIKEGMIFTVEPMINSGKREIKQLSDGWTVVTKDRGISAQWEHTVLVTPTGFDILTMSQGTPQKP